MARTRRARTTDRSAIDDRTGAGGERHQVAVTAQYLTTDHGVPVADGQSALRSGRRGPVLLEDFVLREKVFHFDHERIPERIVHARGSAAHGWFECTGPVPELTCAHLLQERGRRVPVFARFSTVAGGAGSADTVRDVRGFAVKFFTDEGNWDLVGNNIPVFFIQDAMKFPDLVHAVKMEADRGFPQASSAHDTFWDFVSLLPESTHMVLWAMSDRAVPRSLRMIDGFGVHTFRFVRADGAWCFVKFHWRAELGVQALVWDEAVKLAGADPDFHRRDLWEAIASGAAPAWELGVQVFDEAFAAAQPYDVLDPTKLIPEEDVPIRVVGRMVLDRNPDNVFAETEQVAFLPTNLVPGIDVSEDPLLQGRLFSYLDTQKSRLGTTNFSQLPINAPRCPVANFHRDGMMQTHVPRGRANYEPNSLHEAGEEPGPRESPAAGFRTASVPGVDAHPDKTRDRPELFADHYSQARQFWRSQTDVEQGHIVSAFVFELSKVSLPHVRQRTLANLRHVDDDLARRVADGLGLDLPEPSPTVVTPADRPASPALSIHRHRTRDVLEGRTVGILVDDGTPLAALRSLRSTLEAAGAAVKVIAPKIVVRGKGGTITADGQLEGSPSVFFDAVALLITDQAAERLAVDPAAIGFVTDAYVHLKAIGCAAPAGPLLERCGVQPDAGVTGLGAEFLEAAACRFPGREPLVRPRP